MPNDTGERKQTCAEEINDSEENIPEDNTVSKCSSKVPSSNQWSTSDESTCWIGENCDTLLTEKVPEVQESAPRNRDNFGTKWNLDFFPEQPLFNAISSGKAEDVTKLLLEGASIDIMSPTQWNVIHFAAKTGQADILKILLDHNPTFTTRKVNSLCNNGYGPIHFAFENNHIECAKLLCARKANIALKTSNGSTVLHIAARKNNLKLAEFVLQIDPKAVNYLDNFRWSPLHTAIFYGSRDVTRHLILKGADLSASTLSPNRETAIEMIMKHLSKPTEFLESIFDTLVSLDISNEKHELELLQNPDNDLHDGIRDPDIIIVVDYNVLLPESVIQQRFVKLTVIEALLNTGNSCGQRRLLMHPMVESFIYLKWKAFLHIFLLMVYHYFTFVLVITIYVMVNFGFIGSSDKKKNPFIWNTTFWMYVLYERLALAIFQELFFLSVHLKEYVSRIETVVKIVTIILTMILPWLLEGRSPSNSVDWARHTATLTILLGWVYLTFLLSKFPSWGYYVLMFGKVCTNVLKIILSFGCLMIGFSLSFMMELQNHPSFKDFGAAIIKTMVMMTSEFDYDDLIKEEYFSENNKQNDCLLVIRLLFIIFLIFGGIVLINLLVSVSVNDLKDLEVMGRLTQLEKQVEVIHVLGLSLESWVYKLFLKMIFGPHPTESRIWNLYRYVFLERFPIKQIIQYYTKIVDRMRSNADVSLIFKPYEPSCRYNRAIPTHVRDAIFKIVTKQRKIKRERNYSGCVIGRLQNILNKIQIQQTDLKCMKEQLDTLQEFIGLESKHE